MSQYKELRDLKVKFVTCPPDEKTREFYKSKIDQ